jgi:hypothetical protein
LLGVIAAGCREPLVLPPTMNLLAIVSMPDAPPGVSVGTQYTYRVSGLIHPEIDTTLTVAPHDTIILELPVGPYRVELDGPGPWCTDRQGYSRVVAVAERLRTTIARFRPICAGQLVVRTFTGGPQADEQFIYSLLAPDSSERRGLIASNDTLPFDGLTEGRHTLSIGHVAGNCVVTSDGGLTRSFVITPLLTQTIDFSVRCSDPGQRPTLVSFAASYHKGASGVIFRARDPDRDLHRYVWDLTDCHRNSVIAGGSRSRAGLTVDRTRYQDTVTVVAGFEVGVADALVQGRCTAIRLEDRQGNSTPVFEVPIGPEQGHRPAGSVNGHVDQGFLQITLGARDDDNDFVGTFAALTFADGTFGVQDGKPDIGAFNVAGYLGTMLPGLSIAGRFPPDRLRSVIAYLIDANGNMTRLEDKRLF